MTLWSGRFEGGLDPLAWELNASLPVDRRMARQDVRASLAWAEALIQAGVLSTAEGAEIQRGLKHILAEFEAGLFNFQPQDEDIHSAVERRLVELIGPDGGRLHTGRSRNDQVATDFRLWLLENLPGLDGEIRRMQTALLLRAQADLTVVMPGYTHMQRAQPILLSHWWLSHFWPLQRDRERLAQLGGRLRVLPLGSGALAGTAFPIDRFALAQKLGFAAPCQNSLDGVSDRDFAAEFLFITALCGVHLSRMCESLALFSTTEFAFFELPEAYATGSSLMPQKKNPDLFELGRGQSGRLIGLLSGLLTTLKGLPSAYDKDLQEDKAPVFAAYDTLMRLLPVLSGAVAEMQARPEKMRAAIDSGMIATDLADYLVGAGVPFRDAHALAARMVRISLASGVGLEALPLETYRAISESFGQDLYAVFKPENSLARRVAYGGTSLEAVQVQINEGLRMVGEMSGQW